MGLLSMSHQASRTTLAPPLTSNSLTSKLLKLKHFKVCVTSLAGPAARPNQPQPLPLTVSSSVKWKAEESKLFVP